MRKWIGLFLFLVSTAVIGQSEIVDLKNFKADVLNQALIDEVNALRKRKRLDSLTNDVILEKAALDQAQYMAAEQELGHGQKSKLKGSPYKRVLFYGGSHNLIGENVLSYNLESEIKKSKNKLTYQRLAKDLIDQWEKSKPHYENLIEPDYTQIAHQFAIKDGVLFACQVFGSKPFVEKYEFVEGEPISIKDGLECSNCKQVKKKIYDGDVTLGWYTVSNDSIYYWNLRRYQKNYFYNKKKDKYRVSYSKDNLKQIFSANGVLTFDLLHYEQFDCNGKTSFHNSAYHKGYYLGYLDKRTIEQRDLRNYPGLVQVFVGMKPSFADTSFQVDFYLVKKQRSCIQSSTIYVTPDYLSPNEYFQLPAPTMNVEGTVVIEDSVSTRIPFERNQTNEDTSIFKPLISLMDSLIQDDHTIKRVYFTGVASIEGTEKDNRKLINKRGAIIEEYLKRYYPNIPFESEFYENFDDFKSGLVAAGYVDATEISMDTLRMFANDRANDKEIAAILDNSRFSTVKVVYSDQYEIGEGSYGRSVQRIHDLITENKISEIIPLYLLLANQVIDGDSTNLEALKALEFPKNETYAKLHWYDFLFDLAVSTAEITGERLSELQKLGAITSDAQLVEYSLLFNLFYQNQAIKIENQNEIIAGLRDKRQKGWIETLAIIDSVETGQMTPNKAAPMIVKSVLDLKFELNQTYFICQYLIHWGFTTEPYVLLSKFVRRPNQNPKLYAQYLKLGYYLGQFEIENEWKKIKGIIKQFATTYPEEFCQLFKWDEMGIGSLKKKEIAALFCEKCQEMTITNAEE